MNLATATTWLPAAEDLRLFSPELILVATIAAVLFVPLFTGRRPIVAALIAVVGCLVGLQAAGAFALGVGAGGASALTPPGATPLLIADRFSGFFKLFLLLLLVLIIWLWLQKAEKGISTSFQLFREKLMKSLHMSSWKNPEKDKLRMILMIFRQIAKDSTFGSSMTRRRSIHITIPPTADSGSISMNGAGLMPEINY